MKGPTAMQPGAMSVGVNDGGQSLRKCQNLIFGLLVWKWCNVQFEVHFSRKYTENTYVKMIVLGAYGSTA